MALAIWLALVLAMYDLARSVIDACWVGQSLGCYLVGITSRFPRLNVRRFFSTFICSYAGWVGQSLGCYLACNSKSEFSYRLSAL